METLTRRLNNTFGTWSGLKHTFKHGKSLSSIVGPSAPHVYSSEDSTDRMDPRATLHLMGHNRTSSAASGQSSIGSGTSRSISMNSISSEGSNESPMVEQEDIIALTQDVRTFKDALGRLRRIFHPDRDRHETVRVTAHERLGEVLRILRNILEKYGPLQSTELLMAAGQLIQQIKGFTFEDEKSDPTEFFESIDHLALAFSSRVSEYLMGDLDTSSAVHPAARTRSCENLYEGGGLGEGRISKIPDVLTSQQIDEMLMRLEHGVGVALQRAKVWSKYSKDVMTYIEKRSSLEAEYSRNIIKLALAMRPILKEDSFLPFQSIYCSAVDQDVENASHSQATCNLLLGQKFIEPLNERRNKHEKTRKHIKDTWHKELKKMQDAVNNLRKARSLYYQRQQEYEKARESLQKIESLEGTETSKLDKKKKLEDDALLKAMEAETTYKACVVEANERHQTVQKVKADVLKQVRELILQCDQTMKAVTVGYFHLQHIVSAPAPVQFQTLCESSRLYEPGFQYMEYVKRLPVHGDAPVLEPPPFSFEPYIPTDSRLQERDKKASGIMEHAEDQFSSPDTGALRERKFPHPMKFWTQTGLPLTNSDSDSISSQSNKSVDTSPYSSPQIANRQLIPTSPQEEFDLDADSLEPVEFTSRQLSKAAYTHAFRKLKTPSRCRECDCYVYFQGMECTECGLTCHRKCGEILAIQCGHKRLKPKLTTFGIDVTTHVLETQTTVPHIISRCIQEINLRGKNIKGIYRVSGVKSRVEKLCQSFENGAELVDLTEIHPNVIANVIKLYFRQLPEPLLTFRLYPEFVNIAKKYPGKSLDGSIAKELLEELHIVVQKLPPPHFATLALLMTHLKEICGNSSANNMPASNLGIVFGPTLLRTSEGSASFSSLIDTVHQTRVVELLILFAEDLFSDGTVSGTSGSFVIENDISYSSDFNQDINCNMEYERFLPDIERKLSDENVTTLNSDDDLPDSLLPDYSNKSQSLLFPYYSAKEVVDDNDKYKESNSATESEFIVTVHCDSDKLELNATIQQDDPFPNDIAEYGDKDFPSLPVPPPRRHSSHSRMSHSPYLSESDSISIGSTSSGPNLVSEGNFSDKIVIHVQSVESRDKVIEDFIDKTHSSHLDSSPVSTGLSEVSISKSSEINVSFPTTVNVNDNSRENFNWNEIKSSSKTYSPSFATTDRNDPPVPSPRLSRISMAKDLTEISYAVDDSKLNFCQSLCSESGIHVSLESHSPNINQQPSPISSIPSTTSSLDELDEYTTVRTCTSSSSNEYVSPHLSSDPYKNVCLNPGSPVLHARTSTFANYEKVNTQHHLQNMIPETLLPDDIENIVISPSQKAVRVASYPMTELGSRNSLLRTATRHQRYSPSYSISSTKSSGSLASPSPDFDEISDISLIDPFPPSPRPAPRTSVLISHDAESSSESHSLHCAESDSSVLVSNTELQTNESVSAKKSPESRAPQFV